MAKRTKRIGITGGKRGTGKSTAAVLMANDFTRKSKKVILVDCDIECPNDYLLVGNKLDESKKKVYADFPVLDKKKCQKCGRKFERLVFVSYLSSPVILNKERKI